MNPKFEELMEKASAGACHDVETNTLIGTEIQRFAELLLKESFTIIKESMVGEDMTVVDEVIADRLDEAAYDVCDKLGLVGPIYEG